MSKLECNKNEKCKGKCGFCDPVSFSDIKISKKMEIQIIPVGKWKHSEYGNMEISEDNINEFIKNFNDNIRKGVSITEGHPIDNQELPAVGWFKELVNKGSEGLWAVIEWTNKGRELLEEKAYKYFSPEFYFNYEDPETQQKYKNVLTGGALTNMPYFKGLKAIVASEIINKNKGENNMTIEEIKQKNSTDLTDEEKKVLNENLESLSDEEKEKFKDAITNEKEEKKEEKTEENTDEEKKEETDEKKEETEEVKASEMKISGAELKALQMKADAGVEALKQLSEQKIKTIAEKFEFSEKNQDGKFLTKSKEKVVEFMMSLNKGQMDKFQIILSELPKVQIFGEIGDLGNEDTAGKQIENQVSIKMKEDSAMKYTDALKIVLSENVELARKYESENK